MSRLSEIYARVPVNKLAGLVTNQKGCSLIESGVSFEDFNYIFERIKRKHQLLKHCLGITSRAQHKNACGACNKGRKNQRMIKEPRVFAEYRILGRQILACQNVLSEFHKDRHIVGEAENHWKKYSLHTVLIPKQILVERRGQQL